MGGKPTPWADSRAKALAVTDRLNCSVTGSGQWKTLSDRESEIDAAIVAFGSLVERLDQIMPAIEQVEAANYDGLEAVKALPELLKALRIALALPALTSDGTVVPIGSKVECLQEASALLDRLTKKDETDELHPSA